MVTKNRLTEKKNDKFFCHACDYISCNLYDFKKHETTKKHAKNMGKSRLNGNKKSQTVENVCIFCNKKYRHKSGLSRHKKNCKKNPEKMLGMATFSEKLPCLKKDENLKKKKVVETSAFFSADQTDTSILFELVKQQKEQMEMQNKTIELLKESIQTNTEMMPKIGNNNNNTISINVFLNENCKDALNITDFVKNIQLSLDDITYTNKNGFAKGITNIISNQLKDISPIERPLHCSALHCSDNEKLQFYVKDENKWEKDDGDQKFDDIMSQLRLKQIQTLSKWEKMHPDWKDDQEKTAHWQMCVRNITGSKLSPQQYETEKESIKKDLAIKVSMEDAMKI